MAEKALPHEWPQPLESSVSPMGQRKGSHRKNKCQEEDREQLWSGVISPLVWAYLEENFLIVWSHLGKLVSFHLPGTSLQASPSQVLQVSLPSGAVSSRSAEVLAHSHRSCHLGGSRMSFLSRLVDCVCPFSCFCCCCPFRPLGHAPQAPLVHFCVYKVRVLFVACLSSVRGQN